MKIACSPRQESPTTDEYAILFDMDGVLVDVRCSYRKAIQETVAYFTGKQAKTSEIQRLKEMGGYNNDWDLTEAILKRRGRTVPKAEIIKKFQELYLGAEGKAGFIENEKWLLPTEQLANLSNKHHLGIVTGRPKRETIYVLKKFGVENLFDIIVAMEDYPADKGKPDAYPIRLAMKKLSKAQAVYVGDSVDDIIAAKRAGVRAVGCLPPGAQNGKLAKLLLERGAEKIIQNVTEICSLVLELEK